MTERSPKSLVIALVKQAKQFKPSGQASTPKDFARHDRRGDQDGRAVGEMGQPVDTNSVRTGCREVVRVLC
jgi:hypothetical protein